jgi:hypothetical protein
MSEVDDRFTFKECPEISLSHSQLVYRGEVACRSHQRAQGKLRRINIGIVPVTGSVTIAHCICGIQKLQVGRTVFEINSPRQL